MDPPANMPDVSMSGDRDDIPSIPPRVFGVPIGWNLGEGAKGDEPDVTKEGTPTILPLNRERPGFTGIG